ncbi:MAG: hypothetical protein EOO16_01925 [Chitinophagaceae bacterium]|nr:MAG: hypothetical protein EOO16_01925 [Chitinophagaceae bacterium]
MNLRTQAALCAWLQAQNPRHYRKYGRFNYAIARTQEQVATIIDGVVETEQCAQPGDYIITGSRGERFVVRPEVFARRYADLANGIAEARGECWAVLYTGAAFTFEAPWPGAAPMHCAPGDYLAAPDAAISEVYRIEAGVFAETYVAVS